MGLTRAFFCAGASEIIATLWSISDKKTEAVMGSFYHHLIREKNAAKALNAMRKEMIKNGETPFIWGSFTLYSKN